MASTKTLLVVLIAALAQSSLAQNSIYKSTPLPEGLLGVGKPFPRMENGTVLTHSGYTNSPAPSLTVFRLTGTSPTAASLWPADSAVVSVHDACARAGHGAIAVVQAVNASEQRAWLVMSLDPSGRVESEFRTNPYVAHQVAVDGSGNIWTLGVDSEAKEHKADYNIMREYSPDGQLLRSAVPRSTFATKLDPSVNVGGTVGFSFLRARGPNIAAYIAQTCEWIEVAPDGQVVSRAKVRMPANPGYPATYPLILAVTQSGSVFLQSAGFSVCKLDVQSGACSTVNEPKEALLGASGNDLLFYSLSAPTHADWVHP